MAINIKYFGTIISLSTFILLSACRSAERQEESYGVTLSSKELYVLSVQYYMGNNVSRDYGKAFYFCRLSSERGYLAAQSALGYFYLEGIGTEKDSLSAKKWLVTAEKLSDANASLMLDTFGIR